MDGRFVCFLECLSFGSDYDAYQIAKLEKESKELSEMTAQDSIALSLKTAYLELQRLEILRESRKRGLEAAELNFTMDQENLMRACFLQWIIYRQKRN